MEGEGSQYVYVCYPMSKVKIPLTVLLGVLVDDILAKSNNIFGLILLGTLERLQYRVTPCQDRLAATY